MEDVKSPNLMYDKVEEVKDSNENLSSEKNEIPEWMDIIGSGGLKKKILKEGICESRPSKGDSVTVKAQGRLEDGTEVEVLDDFVFTVGGGEVIHGLDLVVSLMDKGEEADVYMEARFAYGEKGLEPNIPPNANLFYKMQIIDYKPEEDPETLSIPERLSIG
ncbi:UNVERIFIED_CONTAM: hypothetical protein GTU68_045827 [Idotea baltica]|nr:hypothetical protein [Idotea baltica]